MAKVLGIENQGFDSESYEKTPLYDNAKTARKLRQKSYF